MKIILLYRDIWIKCLELGIKLTTAECKDLGNDWRGKTEQVREKMIFSYDYKEFKRSQKSRLFRVC